MTSQNSKKQSEKHEDVKVILFSTSVIVLITMAVILMFVPGKPKALEDIQQTIREPMLSRKEVRLDFLTSKKSSLTPSPAPLANPSFEDRTLQSGLLVSHRQRSKHITALNESLGGGACVLDFDNDGWMDLFVIGGSGSTRFYGKHQWWHHKTGNRLYRNLGDGQFEDVTESAGLTEIDWGMGCAAADLDNDGDTDLYLTNYGPNRLYENQGNSTFKDVTTYAGVTGLDNAWSTTAAIADFDGDGLLDIYVTNYLRYKKGMYTLEGEAGFDTVFPRDLHAELFDSQPNILLRNRGKLRFDDVTEQYGVANTEGRSLSAHWLDINGDHRSDLYVTNDTGLPDKVYLNSGDKGFNEIGDFLNISDPTSTTSIAVGDLNNNGYNDILLGSHAGAVTRLLLNPGQTTEEASMLPFSEEGRNRLENIESTNVSHNWGIGLYDFNLDGWLDIFLANGLTTPDPDTHARLTTGQINQLWLNTGEGQFRQFISEINSPLRDALPSRGTVFADFDNDGDTDIFINNNNELGQLLINKLDTPSSWIGVRLIGNSVNRDGIGAVVKLSSDGGMQQRRVGKNFGFLSTSDPRMIFGLNKKAKNVSLKITWPDGAVDHISQPSINTYIVIRQGENSYQTRVTPVSTESGSSLLLPDGQNMSILQLPYLKILAAEESPLLALEINNALRHPSIEIRQSTSQFIKYLPQIQQLPLLVTLLEDESIELQKRALDLLVKTEQEATYRWLLSQLMHTAPAMRLIATEAFYDYFRKEEAMIIHKYQTIPHLIRRLDDSSLEVKLAAIKALGASEHFRATGPLIELLSNQPETIRQAAAQALGHVRERLVIKALNGALETESSPGVMANILISLKRLNAQGVDEQLRTLIISDRLEADEKTALLRHLFQHGEESTVFDPVVLTKLVMDRLLTIKNDKGISKKASASLDMLATLGSPFSIPTLTKFLTSQNPAVRESACFGLAKIDLKKLLTSHLSICSSVIKSDPSQFFQEMAESIIKNHSKLNFQEISKLLPKLQPAQLAENLSLISIESIPTVVLVKIVNLDTAPIMARKEALQTLIHRSDAPDEISDQMLFNENSSIQALAIRYWGEHGINNLPPEVITPQFNELVEKADSEIIIDTIASTIVKMPKRIALPLLNRRLISSTEKNAIRKALLTVISKNQLHIETVLELAKKRHDDINLEAILALGQYKDKRASNYLHHVYNNADETRQARVAAAIALYPTNASTIIPFLTGTL